MKKYTFYIGPTVDYIIKHTDSEPEIFFTQKKDYQPDSVLKKPIAQLRLSEDTPNVSVFKEISAMIISGDRESTSLAKTWLQEGEELFNSETQET